MLDNLTKDAIEAEKAGMSYGQWKAIHPKTKSADRRSKLKLNETKTYRMCRICGAKFEVKHPHHYICSDECRLKSEREYNREWQRKLREKRNENKED